MRPTGLRKRSRKGSGRAPVGGVLAPLGKHVRERSEAEAVQEKRQQGGYSMGDPAIVGVDDALERAKQQVVGVVHRLAELAIQALASGLLAGTRRDRDRVPGVALELPVQLALLGPRATVELVGREIGEPEQDEAGAHDGHEADEGAHRDYY